MGLPPSPAAHWESCWGKPGCTVRGSGSNPAPTHPMGVPRAKLLSASQAPAIKSLLCRSCLVYGWVFGFLGAEAASLSSVSSLWSMFCALSLDALGFCISSSSLGTF